MTPTVDDFMSKAPHTIGDAQPLSTAIRLMGEHAIRHLPVLRGGELVGMLSQRDLLLIENAVGPGSATLPVSDAMSPDTFTVTPKTPLRDVAEKMAKTKAGSVVVMEGVKVVGVFTTVDAMRALSSVLGR